MNAHELRHELMWCVAVFYVCARRFTTPHPAPPVPADAEAAAADAAAETVAAHAEEAAAAVDHPQAAADAAAAAAADAPDAMDVTEDMTEVTTEVTASTTLDGGSDDDSDDEYMSAAGEEFTTMMELPVEGWNTGGPPPAAAAGSTPGGVSNTSLGDASPPTTPAAAAAAAADADMMPDVEELQAAFANAGGGFGAEFAESYGELPTAAVPPPAAAPAQPQPQQQQGPGQYACSGSSSSKASWQQRGVSGVTVLHSPASVHEVEHSNAASHMLLCMPLLCGPRSGNVAVVKLINCEDKMAEYEDPSEEPNIDVQYVALRGVSVTLDRATGLQLL
jgi:hypothetical protein